VNKIPLCLSRSFSRLWELPAAPRGHTVHSPFSVADDIISEKEHMAHARKLGEKEEAVPPPVSILSVSAESHVSLFRACLRIRYVTHKMRNRSFTPADRGAIRCVFFGMQCVWNNRRDTPLRERSEGYDATFKPQNRIARTCFFLSFFFLTQAIRQYAHTWESRTVTSRIFINLDCETLYSIYLARSRFGINSWGIK